MKNSVNPFRRIAGWNALAWGLIFIFACSLALWLGGCWQNSLLHFGPATLPLWQVTGVQLFMWLLTALPLWGIGAAVSRSRVRAVDVFGTTAFAQITLLPLIAPLLLGPVRRATEQVTRSLDAGGLERALPPLEAGEMAVLLLTALWGLACLALYYAMNYRAYAVSCNVRGAKGVVSFIVASIFSLVAGLFAGAWLSSWLLP